ncbi:energy-coupling factor ABC transporter ATP-binding protein [Deinococcus radiodurans]|nr:energy-coupling factor ABC transporter ATP-binding protein [Deinococcus radiodurans]
MIELRHVSHHYDERPVLRPLSLTLRERRIGVVGSNGSGKSTFARLLNALLLPAAGQVLVDGLDTRQDPKGVRRKVGFVFQNPDHQIVFPVVEEDLAFGLKNLKLPPAEVEARIGEVLERYDLGNTVSTPRTCSAGAKATARHFGRAGDAARVRRVRRADHLARPAQPQPGGGGHPRVAADGDCGDARPGLAARLRAGAGVRGRRTHRRRAARRGAAGLPGADDVALNRSPEAA